MIRIKPVRDPKTYQVKHFVLEASGELTDAELHEIRGMVSLYSSPAATERARAASQRRQKRPLREITRPAGASPQRQKPQGLTAEQFDRRLREIQREQDAADSSSFAQ